MTDPLVWYLVGAVFTMAVFGAKEPEEFKRWHGWSAAILLSCMWPLAWVLMLGAAVGKTLR